MGQVAGNLPHSIDADLLMGPKDALNLTVLHSSLRKIMHVTVCHMPCMHQVSASLMPPTPVQAEVCELLDMNFREHLPSRHLGE
jgi:hypothetical protein